MSVPELQRGLKFVFGVHVSTYIKKANSQIKSEIWATNKSHQVQHEHQAYHLPNEVWNFILFFDELSICRISDNR